MTTKKTATQLQGNKTANKKSELLGKAIKALDNLTQKSVTSETSKKVDSNYKTEVLESNKLLKQESKTLGYCVKVLTNNINILKLSPLMVKNLNAINKDSEVYKLAVLNCRKSKNGNYSPFYLLQYLYSISK
jgi:hypothetical protein